MASPIKVAILGAGITGLSLAYYLEKLFKEHIQITIIDKANCVGGMIQTDRVQDALFERGPHTLRLAYPYKQTCLDLFKEINLLNEMVIANTSSQKRYVGFNQKLHLVKPSLKLLFPFLLEPFRKKIDQEQSIYDFFSSRLNPYITRNLIDPMVRGIYGGNIQHLSLEACFPLFKKLKKSSRPLLLQLLHHKRKNPSLIVSFDGGLQRLPTTIKEHLKANLLLDSPIQSITFKKKARIHLKEDSFSFDSVFSCLPAPALQVVLEDTHLKQSIFFEELKQVCFKVIHLGFSKNLPIEKGFGFLTPSWNDEKITGAIFASSIFPEQDSSTIQTRLTVMIDQASPLFHLEEKKLIDEVCRYLEGYLNQPLNPIYQKVYSENTAIPQYGVGHLERLSKLKEMMHSRSIPLHLLGNSYLGCSVPSCIQQGKDTAQAFYESRRLGNLQNVGMKL